MHTIALICFVAASALAMPNRYLNIDDAITIFPLVATQSKGGNPTSILPTVIPYMTQEKVLDDQTRIMLLAAGGLTTEQSNKMIREVLPTLAREGKSTYEQLMALMFVSNQYCTDKNTPCDSDAESLLPFITVSSERGCLGDHIHASVRISNADECVCDDQDNVLLWISLLDKIKSASETVENKGEFSSQVSNQVPVVLMMMLTETSCDGTLRGSGARCQCSSVTEGNEGLLMRYVVNTPGIEKILTPDAKTKIQEYSREPTTRMLSDLLPYIAGGLPSPMLSIFANSGATTSEKLMQLVLAGTGVDSSTAQLFLSGALNQGGNKVALINYLANSGLVSADAVPFILGVDKGSTFFIQSLIQSGAIDPILGNFLLAKQSGSSQSDVFELITRFLTGNTIDIKDIGKPYIPPLPAGIYPGTKLYFAHLEALGINTCALHDLRNRFNCGFDGISAAQCEVLPYCCYNPVFLTDTEVANMTANAITSATAVPWCYYNVFFIYYNSFALTVQRPGGFAGPESCLPLFKYGLNLDASVYYIYAQSASSSSINSLINARGECGYPGITEFHCVAIRGCCWDPYASYRVPQCYFANGASPLEFDLNSIPAAYQPRNQTCNLNYYQFPTLYYRRVACMPTWDMFVKGRDPLKLPDKYECLWELGCCWEEDTSVLQKYPHSPRCYQREDGYYAVQPFNIGLVTDLITRSGSPPPIDKAVYPGAPEYIGASD